MSATARRGVPVRWSLVLATLAALAVIVVLRSHQPTYDDKVAPILAPGVIGQRAQARNFAVTVKKLKLAGAYRVDGAFDAPSRVVRADGTWLSALLEVEALRDPGYVSAQLRTRDGRVYSASGRERPRIEGVNLAETQLVPGLPASGAYFFDVPAAQLEGATLQFYWGTLAPNAMDHLLDIDLQLDAQRLRALRTATVPELDMRTRMDR